MDKLIRNAYLVYNSLKHVPINISAAALTTMKLNKHPLPKQPVPDLKKTISNYLRSLKPLLNEKEYNTTEKLACEFIKKDGIGVKLQSKLLERFEKTTNWMSDWWLNAAYLGYRAPVIVNSSPGTVGPQINFKSPDEFIVFAARLVRGVFDYDHFIKSGKLEQEKIGDIPLDMKPYALILGTHRQPKKGCDELIHTDESNHIIIISNNHLFKLCINDKSGILSESKLVNAIKDIIKRSCEDTKPVGILTGNDRDSWVDDYHVLLELGNNKCIVEDIESSLFILCLDKDMAQAVHKGKNNASIRALQSLTGFSTCTNAGNRWHDKTVQFIISPDGFVGMEYEHSPCEAIPIAVLFDHVLKYIESQKSKNSYNDIADFLRAEHLKFEVDKTLESSIKTASCLVDNLSEDTDMECFTFDEFGTQEIKKFKLSPDSFIQTALQVTYYKVHKEAAVHYESAALRRFEDARTECIRSTSCESVAFASAMALNNFCTKREELRKLMIDAVNMHKQIANEAVIGEGVDRHLFGLQMIAKSEGIELPALFNDTGYIKSTHFTLTSSQVPYKSQSFLCYGPAVLDGYGCCYNPRPTDILFACSSFKSCKVTDSKLFATNLQEVLHEMKELGSV